MSRKKQQKKTVICLKCNQEFASTDKRRNRICAKCTSINDKLVTSRIVSVHELSEVEAEFEASFRTEF